MECAFTSPVIIESGMLVMYLMQFAMSVSVLSMVSLYLCVVCVDDLWCLDVCECGV